MVPFVYIAVGYFIIFPVWLAFRIRKELTFSSFCNCNNRAWKKHEQELVMVETEYVSGLDVHWATQNYAIFSSFRRPWAYFRPLSFINKVIILLIYGCFYYHQQYQSIILFVYIFITLVIVALFPAYRIGVFNLMLTFNLFLHLCNLLIGILLVLKVQNALLVGQNLLYALLVLNVSWILVTITCLAYIFLGNSKNLTAQYGSLWPSLTDLNSSKKEINDHTVKYFTAMLRARQDLEMCYSYPKLFAPVHKLSRHIQIINAYCREAELLDNIGHQSLLSLLLEMVDVYNTSAPLSLFSQHDNKSAYFQVVSKLLTIMPAFQKRLDQRKRDLNLLKKDFY